MMNDHLNLDSADDILSDAAIGPLPESDKLELNRLLG